MEDLLELQRLRLQEAGIFMPQEELAQYFSAPDELPEPKAAKGAAPEVPLGYKRCGRCHKIKKLYLFNRNSNSKTNCTGNCKECQKVAAQISYDKNKGKRNYKEYYAEHKESKQEQSRQYYQKHKDEISRKQKNYRGSAAGKRVMRRSHAKRKYSLERNSGIPYTRDIVIDRDKQGQEFPICYLCGEPIKVDSDIQLDHVIPVALEGADDFTNIACTHKLCNLRKSKDAREITVEQVEGVMALAEKYIDEHHDLFPQLFEEPASDKKVD
jgi:hypothetical protein